MRAGVAGSHFGRQVDYPVRYHLGEPVRTYIAGTDVRDERGRMMWRCYRLVDLTREYVGPAALTWRAAYRLCRRLNREAGLAEVVDLEQSALIEHYDREAAG